VTEAVELFVSFLKAATFSVGGLSSLPVLQQELVVTGHVSDQQVLESLAIGRLSTGPNGLYVVSLGYFAYGWAGAAIALVAASIPPLLIVPAAAVIRRQLLSPWAAGVVRGVALSTSGLLVATAIALLAPVRSADLAGIATAVASVPAWQIALAAVALAITVHGRLHPALLIVGGAVAGVALGR
jgi:chromate transporter